MGPAPTSTSYQLHKLYQSQECMVHHPTVPTNALDLPRRQTLLEGGLILILEPSQRSVVLILLFPVVLFPVVLLLVVLLLLVLLLLVVVVVVAAVVAAVVVVRP